MSNFIKVWTQKEVEHLTTGFRRHSVFVFVLKFILPLAALAMAAVLFVYPHLSGKKNAIHLHASEAVNTPQNAHPDMVNPKFLGLDSKNEEYQIIAKHAINASDTTVNLEDVTGDITLQNGDWVSGSAKHGVYDRDRHTLTLTDDVNIFITDAKSKITHLTGSEVFMDMDNGITKSTHPIKAKSDYGFFDATAFVANKDSQKINFSGPIKLIILHSK